MILIHILTCGCVPVLLIPCIILVTGDVYYNRRDERGNLKKWSIANKVIAIVILVVNLLILGWVFLAPIVLVTTQVPESGTPHEHSEVVRDNGPSVDPREDSRKREYQEERARKEAYAYIVAFEENLKNLADQLADAQRQGYTPAIESLQEVIKEYDEKKYERLKSLTGMTKEQLLEVKREGDREGWPSPRRR